MNENFMDGGSNFEAKGSFKIIIAIICVILIALMVLLIILSRSDKPDKVFKTTIDQAKENVASFIDDIFSETTILEDKATTKIDLTFSSNMDELSFLNDYKFMMTQSIDYENKYINAALAIQEKDKLINEMIMYAVNDKLYMDLGEIYDKPLDLGEYLAFDESYNTSLFNDVNKDDLKYLITNYLEYFKLSLIKEQFAQEDEEIKINDENIKVKANIYTINAETHEQMNKNIKDKIINDDKMIDILSKISGIDKEEVISNLKGENVNEFVDTAGRSEANMVLSGINNYCATSAMKSQLDGSVDICADGVTVDEVSTMVSLGNIEVTKVTYENEKVTELVVVSNGITYTLQSDGSFTSSGNEEVISDNIEITIYTKPHSNKYLGFNISENNKSIIHYTVYEEIENLFVDFGEENTMIMKGEGNIIDATFATNGIDTFNINANVIDENNTEITFNLLNSYYAEIKLILSNKAINENEESLDLKLSMSYGNKLNPYKLDLNAIVTIYKNSDIEVVVPKDYININELTEKDYILIQENMEKIFKGTAFEMLFTENQGSLEANQF